MPTPARLPEPPGQLPVKYGAVLAMRPLSHPKVKACFAALARAIRMTGLRGSGASSPATENLVGRNASIHTRVPRTSHAGLARKWRIIPCHRQSRWPQCRHSYNSVKPSQAQTLGTVLAPMSKIGPGSLSLSIGCMNVAFTNISIMARRWFAPPTWALNCAALLTRAGQR